LFINKPSKKNKDEQQLDTQTENYWFYKKKKINLN